MEEVTVKMETRIFIECPTCETEEDIDLYQHGIFECVNCGLVANYNSEPENCEQV